MDMFLGRPLDTNTMMFEEFTWEASERVGRAIADCAHQWGGRAGVALAAVAIEKRLVKGVDHEQR